MNIEEMKQHEWSISWSGGKDSTATVILCHEYGIPIKERITFSDAEEIRKIVGKTDKEIAEIYGISRGSVWQIRKGITYARA